MDHPLNKRVRYFFSTRYRHRSEVHETLGEFNSMGRVAAVGGMLRDLALFGNRSFCSDIDLVIAPHDLDEFTACMRRRGGVRNRFGGYALPSKKWRIDVWALPTTWAHVQGHVTVKSLEDIKRTTFFDCDAILYDFSDRRLKFDNDYFEKLHERTININLLPNPNPIGNAVRAFRYAMLKNLRWGPDLTCFVAEMVEEYGWTTLAQNEKKSFNTCCIEVLDKQKFRSALVGYLSNKTSESFAPACFVGGWQLSLPLDNPAITNFSNSPRKQAAV